MKRWVPAVVLCLAPIVALVAHAGGASVAPGVPPRVSTASVRMLRPLAAGWRFVQDDAMSDEGALASTGAAWQPVTLPHTWNATDAASTTATVPYKRGRGWYRLAFDRPSRGARHWLQFDGASIVADVWLNGKKLGRHKGAFTAFRFDVTDLLRPAGNVLVVKTDNSEPKADADLTAIAPLGGDFNMSGGLYRAVTLVSTPSAVHLSLDDFGGSGVYARTTSVTDPATVNVRVKVANDGSSARTCVVRAAMVDAAGRTAGEVRQNVKVGPKGSAEAVQDIEVRAPHLWQGVSDPYLYSLLVDVLDSRGVAVDRVVQPFGIRQMAFDPNEGFFLNGKPTPLHGVAMHQDYLGKGWAIGERETDESLALVKEVGANTLRLAHYPHGEYTLREADRLGFVVWAEVPFVNGVRVACSTDEATTDFTSNLEQQLRELIRQQYNHASIGMWSIGNETTMIQARCGGGKRGPDNVTPVLRRLHQAAKAEDPGRATTMADLNEGTSEMFGGDIPVGGISDVWALNRYFLWYYGDSEQPLARNLDALHARYPKQPVGISEYGAGAALSDHTDNPLGGPVSSFNMGVPRVYQPEEYADYVHERNYQVMAARKYVWGTYLWNMFDFGSGIRNEGDLRGVNTKGLVTFDRRTRKDPFYFYKANWSHEPVTHIEGRRYTDRAYAVTDVKVYSNADAVRLSVNGAPVGSMTAGQCPQKTCVFRNVALRPGRNVVAARGTRGGVVTSDEVEWTLANASDVNVAAGQIATGFRSSNGARYGSDNFFTGGAGRTLAGVGLTRVGDHTPVRGVADANDAKLYAAYRSGSFRYDIPLANGSYSVTLGFLEPAKATAVGGRVFSVEANGVKAIADLDVLREAGAYRTAVTRSFPVTVADGRLVLVFTPSAGEALVSNISVTKK